MLKLKILSKIDTRRCNVTIKASVLVYISVCTNVQVVEATANIRGSSNIDIVMDKR